MATPRSIPHGAPTNGRLSPRRRPPPTWSSGAPSRRQPAIHGFFRLSAMMGVVSRSLVRPVLVAIAARPLMILRALRRRRRRLAARMRSAGRSCLRRPPRLLGPITSAGRVGWECKPERPAASPAGTKPSCLPRRVVRDRCVCCWPSPSSGDSWRLQQPHRPIPATPASKYDLGACAARSRLRNARSRNALHSASRPRRGRLDLRRCRIQAHRRAKSAGAKRLDRSIRSCDRIRESRSQ